MEKFNFEQYKIKIELNPKIYPLEAVLGAAYFFLDKNYVYLDGNLNRKIIVQIKPKDKAKKNTLEDLGNDFLNKLLHYNLRYQISKNNRKIREYIVGTALLSAIGEAGEEDDWKKDFLDISTPWEEKYGNEKK